MKELAIIIPTLNEKDNIPILINTLSRVLKGIEHEIIIVDDNSPDGTWKVVEELKKSFSHLKSIRRIGRQGLSSAVIEGTMLSESKFIAAMDGDLQHDPKLIPQMLLHANTGSHIVVASRFMSGGNLESLAPQRIRLSKFAALLGNKMFQHDLTDPMSGFFLMERKVLVDRVERLDGKGFKILLDVLSNYSPGELRIREIPYTFRTRRYGESKLSLTILIEFFDFLYSRKFGKFIPLLFFKYILVGSFGAVIHFFVLFVCFKMFHFRYNASLVTAIELTILFNFFFNNLWTFTDKRIRGIRYLTGLIRYNLSCIFGGFINLVMSNYLIGIHLNWAIASILGALAASIWNYNLSRIITWRYFFD